MVGTPGWGGGGGGGGGLGHGGLFVVAWLLGCLMSQQHAGVSQGRICSDNFTCCHTEIEVADQTFYLIQSQYTDTGPTSPSTDPIVSGAWQGSHSKLALQWLPSQAPGVRGSALGLVGPVSVYCDRVR